MPTTTKYDIPRLLFRELVHMSYMEDDAANIGWDDVTLLTLAHGAEYKLSFTELKDLHTEIRLMLEEQHVNITHDDKEG